MGAGIVVDQGGYDGDAECSPQVAQHVEQGGGGGDLVRRQAGGRHQGERHHDEGLPQRPHDERLDQLGAGVIRTHVHVHEAADGEHQKAEAHQIARVYLVGQFGHQWQHQQLGQSHPHQHLADFQRVVVVDLGHVERQHIDGAHQRHAEHQVGEAGQREARVVQQPQVDQRVAAQQLTDDEEHQRHHRDDGEPHDEAGTEPVLPVALFQHHFQQAQPHRHGKDADEIHPLDHLPVHRLLVQPVGQHGHHQQSRRHVQVEDVVPGHLFGQPAAQGRADGGGEGGAQAEQRHAGGPLVQRQQTDDEGEGHRDQRPAGEALQRPKDDHAGEVPAERAEHGGDDEGACGPQQVAPHTQAPAQPAAQRDGDHLRHQIGGGDPGALAQGGRQGPLNVLQGGVGDLDVEDGHEGADEAPHDRDPVAAWYGVHQLAATTGSGLRVSTITSVERPGSSLPASAPGSGMRIFTGTRCTILVKLPVAFSGGSRANLAPVAGARLSMIPSTG